MRFIQRVSTSGLEPWSSSTVVMANLEHETYLLGILILLLLLLILLLILLILLLGSPSRRTTFKGGGAR